MRLHSKHLLEISFSLSSSFKSAFIGGLTNGAVENVDWQRNLLARFIEGILAKPPPPDEKWAMPTFHVFQSVSLEAVNPLPPDQPRLVVWTSYKARPRGPADVVRRLMAARRSGDPDRPPAPEFEQRLLTLAQLHWRNMILPCEREMFRLACQLELCRSANDELRLLQNPRVFPYQFVAPMGVKPDSLTTLELDALQRDALGTHRFDSETANRAETLKTRSDLRRRGWLTSSTSIPKTRRRLKAASLSAITAARHDVSRLLLNESLVLLQQKRLECLASPFPPWDLTELDEREADDFDLGSIAPAAAHVRDLPPLLGDPELSERKPFDELLQMRCTLRPFPSRAGA